MKYLFVGAHIDDLELCAGGYVARCLDYGHEVSILVLSHEYNGVSLMHEWLESMKVLKPDFCEIKDFNTRNFNLYRQQILDLLFTKKGYDYVITHSANDFHQDHQVVGEESIRAFKHTNLLTYTGVWNSRGHKQNYFVELTEAHVQKKIQALACYYSQDSKPYLNSNFIKGNLITNGVIAGTKYAEAFEVINFLE